MFGEIKVDMTSADSMIYAFAISIWNGSLNSEEIRSFVLDSVDGDEEITDIVMEKIDLQVECLRFSKAATGS